MDVFQEPEIDRLRRENEHYRRAIDASPGITAMLAERREQIERFGFDREHDAQWRQGELVAAAIVYATQPGDKKDAPPPALWPWDDRWWKPKTRVQNLIRAGALIAAELDRMVVPWPAEDEEQEPE